jgi:hypothetical protein
VKIAAWLPRAIDRARGSALPAAMRLVYGDDDMAVDDAVDAVAACLLAVTEPTEAGLRAALRVLVEPHAARLDLPWEVIADAILAALDNPAPTPLDGGWA